MTQDSLSPALQDQLRQLSEGYAKRLPDKLSHIEMLWNTVRNDEPARWPGDALQDLHRLVHSIAGSGATFGFADISRHARRAEQVLKPLALGNTAPDETQERDIDAALADLKVCAHVPFALNSLEQNIEDAAAAPRREVVVLCDDAASLHSWVPALEAFGIEARICPTERLFRAALEGQPCAIIVQSNSEPLAMKVEDEPISSLLAHRPEDGAPLLWLSPRGDLRARLQAVRLGSSAYLTQPVDVDALLVRLDELARPGRVEPFRVLIVDDDPSLSRLFSLILRQAGIETVEVNDPLCVMEPLVSFRPDLVLMDIFMPGCKGTELAAVIRQQDAFVGLPIVFLSVQSDLAQQQRALRLGGDDFLCKPIEPKHLVAAVTMRATRARAVRHAMTRDTLTGALSHSQWQEQLEIEVSRAMRQDQPLAVAIVDLDGCSDINERFGHLAGDRVLRALCRMLGQHLRQTDVIGRWSGERFAVILSGSNAANAARRLNEVRANFAALPLQAEGEEFHATFSCGIASAAPNGESVGLLEGALGALRRAKEGGRNRVEIEG